jgi:hypothetical protein
LPRGGLRPNRDTSPILPINRDNCEITCQNVPLLSLTGWMAGASGHPSYAVPARSMLARCSSIELALFASLIGRVRRRAGIERLPSSLAISGAPVRDFHRARSMSACSREASASGTRALTTAPPRRNPSAYTSASSLLTPACVSPMIPPVAPPATAPVIVATSHPAGTTGPTPGIANRPSPASSPAAPPRVAPTPAPVPAASLRSSLRRDRGLGRYRSYGQACTSCRRCSREC